MQKQELGWMERTVIVCVDSYANGVPEGRLFHSRREGGLAFHSLSRFLIEMDQALDAMAFPQSFNTVRTFGEAPKLRSASPPQTRSTAGKLATFSIRVLFRQNASWQGSVQWIEGSREESFRSAMELALLMDGALNADARTEQDTCV